MNMKDYDLIILGQGSAAFAAAIKADELGIKTAMIGGNATSGATVGGTCVNVGCVPSKNLITVGNAFHGLTQSSFGAIHYGRTRLDFKKAIEEKDALVERFRNEKYADVLNGLQNVEYVPGVGRFVSRKEVKAGDTVLKAKKFLIATGARAKVVPVKGVGGVGYLTNEEALSLKKLPRSMIVVGGRALGLEFAQMYAHFGTKVTVLQRSDRILPEHEPEISSALKGYLQDEGIDIQTGVKLTEVVQRGEMRVVRCTVKGNEKVFQADQLLFASGRVPNTDYLSADKAGVELDSRGFVKVNDEMHTRAPHVWAAGDVIGEPMLETIAAKEGAVAVNNAFGEGKKRIDFKEVPNAVFTYPEVASVGLTDAQANEQGIKCACGVLPLDMVPKARIMGDTRGLIKLVADSRTKRVVGLHILAPHAADLIHEGVLAVKFRLTIDDIIDTVHVFPTLSEAVKLAAQSFYRDVGKMSCCTE
ncbi:MAG: mercury(II) reductase [Nitrososphaerota archaeon]|nr:mercury(II) reductase [Nitrososphaerota archaeon]MDG7025914.1 mercury(II) reductase [Nitrososphaerota archaeon]